ncbi:MAG: CheR family methyltransferase [Solirubrobacteraceae bacterium]|nr:CheR family methyltransferase [Patulibacter sp.]
MPISVEDVQTLSAASDLELAMFRPAHVEARVARALEKGTVADIVELGSVLRHDPGARTEFRRSIAISVTGFFRDADQFELLAEHTDHLRYKERPRVWSAGCSTGAELWTLAVLLDRLGAAGRAQLLGSDILDENIRRARAGLDEGELAGHVLPEDAKPWFEVRDIVTQGPPGGGWDIVLCRNMAIYLEPNARQRLHGMLAESLAPGGLLLLGRSERLSDPRALGMEFVAPHLYRRAGTA